MTNLEWCIDYLKRYNDITSYFNGIDFNTFRGLMNITMPINLSQEYYAKQDDVLQELLKEKEIVNVDTFKEGISLFKGDITILKADAIVNACNEKLLGCFVPGHHCIDNAIHTFAGLQVRRDMMEIMERQGKDEESGKCKVSGAYNLPSKYIFHTVGPIYSGIMKDNIDLFNCYYSCLKKADDMGLNSIVFCSLSTGIYGFPIEKACDIAVGTVSKYLKEENKNIKRVVFDVFSEGDKDVYTRRINKIN